MDEPDNNKPDNKGRTLTERIAGVSADSISSEVPEGQKALHDSAMESDGTRQELGQPLEEEPAEDKAQCEDLKIENTEPIESGQEPEAMSADESQATRDDIQDDSQQEDDGLPWIGNDDSSPNPSSERQEAPAANDYVESQASSVGTEAPETELQECDSSCCDCRDGRMPTGVKNIDDALSGGLLPGSVILVIGEPGSGKTLLLRQFFCKGVEIGDPCICLLTNRLLDRVLISMKNLGYDLSDKPNAKFILYDGFANKRTPSYVGNFEDLIDIAYNTEKLISSFPPGNRRMIIDDLSYLFLMHGKDTVFKFIRRLSQIWRENNVTCIMEVQRGMLDPQIIIALESMATGTLETKREGNKKSVRICRLDDDITDSEWMSVDMPPTTHIGSEGEKTLDEWQKTAFEGDPHTSEERVRFMLKNLRERDGDHKKRQ
jgi:KaiC/GvpD/RAD55 family RecA-like ATPase